MTTRPSQASRDPLEAAIANQRRTCHACRHEEQIEIAGTARTVCALDKKHGKRCGAYSEKKAMTLDESIQIEDLLTGWYDWQASYKPNLGAGRVDPSCRGFAENDRHSTIDERTEAAERRARAKQAEQIDLCVDALHWQQRAAIQCHMKNKVAGAQVWRNARVAPEEMHVLYQEAKFALLPSLRRRGMIKAEAIAW